MPLMLWLSLLWNLTFYLNPSQHNVHLLKGKLDLFADYFQTLYARSYLRSVNTMNLGLPKRNIDSSMNPLILINICNYYLVRDIKTPNYESCFPNFSKNFSQFKQLKKNFSMVQTWERNLFWTNSAVQQHS